MGIDPAPSRRAHDYAQRLHHCDRRIQALNVGRREVADEERTNGVREAHCARYDRQRDDEKAERNTRDKDLASALGENGVRRRNSFLFNERLILLHIGACGCMMARRERLKWRSADAIEPRKSEKNADADEVLHAEDVTDGREWPVISSVAGS